MVIQIRLSDRIDHTPEQIEADSLNRLWCGYDPTVSDRVLWEHNRGRWALDESRIADEQYATFVHGGRVVAAFAIEGHERVADPGPKGTKIALIGRPLAATDPNHRRLVGRPAIHRGRNAVNYVADGPADEVTATEFGRRAFLLTWNPENYPWADFGQCVLSTEVDDTTVGRWSTGGRTTGIRLGDLVFMLRQGTNGRGLVGCGQAADLTGDASPDDEIIYTDVH